MFRTGSTQSTSLLITKLIVIPCALVLFSQGTALAQKKKKDEGKLIEMTWIADKAAKKKGRQAGYGIVYYFPPNGGERDHEFFKTEEMCDFSRSCPCVKVVPSNKKLVALRERYEVPEKYPVIVITDYHGNFFQMFKARKLNDKKFKFGVIQKAITGTDRRARGTEARLAKDLAKAEKHLKARKYRQTISALEWAATIVGFKDAERAAEIMAECAEVGKERLERLIENPEADDDAQKKALRKIAKDFKGTDVEEKVKAEISRINKAAKEKE